MTIVRISYWLHEPDDKTIKILTHHDFVTSVQKDEIHAISIIEKIEKENVIAYLEVNK